MALRGVRQIYRGSGAPTAALAQGQLYFDYTNIILYIGTDGTLGGNKVIANGGDSGDNYAVDTGTANAKVVALLPVPDAYTAGMHFFFLNATANTGATTINANALGAKSIKKEGDAALVDGDLKVNHIYELVYDGTNFQLVDEQEVKFSQIINGLDARVIYCNPDWSGDDAASGRYNDFATAYAAVVAGQRLVLLKSITYSDPIVAKSDVTIEIPRGVELTLEDPITFSDDNIQNFRIKGEGSLHTTGRLISGSGDDIAATGTEIDLDGEIVIGAAIGEAIWSESTADFLIRSKTFITVVGEACGEGQFAIWTGTPNGANSITLEAPVLNLHTFSSNNNVDQFIVKAKTINLPNNAQGNKANFGLFDISADVVYLNDNVMFNGDADVNVNSSFTWRVKRIYHSGSLYMTVATSAMTFTERVMIKQTSATADVDVFSVTEAVPIAFYGGAIIYNAGTGASYLINGVDMSIPVIGTLYSNKDREVGAGTASFTIGTVVIDAAVSLP